MQSCKTTRIAIGAIVSVLAVMLAIENSVALQAQEDDPAPPAPIVDDGDARRRKPQLQPYQTPITKFVLLRVDKSGLVRVFESKHQETTEEQTLTRTIRDQKTGQEREESYIVSKTVKRAVFVELQKQKWRFSRVDGTSVKVASFAKGRQLPALLVVGAELSDYHRKLLKSDSLLIHGDKLAGSKPLPNAAQ